MESILKAKKYFKNIYLMKFEKDHLCLFRILPWKEYKSYREIATVFPKTMENIKDEILAKCIIEYVSPEVMYKHGKLTMDAHEMELGITRDGWATFPKAMEFATAGAMETVFNLIWRLSGRQSSGDIMEDLQLYRPYAEMNVEERLVMAACTVTKYKPSDFEDMEWPDIVTAIAQSELILEGKIVPAPFHLQDDK